jgi:hypothetical protein
VRRTSLILAGLLTAVALTGCGSSDDSSSGESSAAAGSTSTSTSAPEPDADAPAEEGDTTVLTADAAAATGRCAVPTPALVKGNDLAFDGEVQSIDGGLVTLRPTAVYVGEPAATVTVQAPSEDLQALLAAVSFEEGGRYLVAAQDGRLALCTVTARWSQQLAATYEQAFGAPR